MDNPSMNRVTDLIIQKLENGVIPWQQPWGEARNLVSGKPYRGYNAFVLGISEYESEYWVTSKQARDLGGWVKYEERFNGIPIIFWNVNERKIEDSNGETKIQKYAFLKHYMVFNIDQCDRLHRKVPKKEKKVRVPGWRKIVQQFKGKPEIKNGGNKACYVPLSDTVRMPALKSFDCEKSYASVLFHELTHSTGHKKRLNRDGIRDIKFGSEVYSEEELIAEIGAAFLCGTVGILERTVDNSAAYIKSWLKVLKNDRGMILSSAAKAQKATDLILGKETEQKAKSKNEKSKTKTEEKKIVKPKTEKTKNEKAKTKVVKKPVKKTTTKKPVKKKTGKPKKSTVKKPVTKKTKKQKAKKKGKANDN